MPPGFQMRSPSCLGIQRLHGRLPLPESVFYTVTGIGSILYVMYHVYLASQEFLWLLYEKDFVDGWPLLRHKKDISNYEWNFWSNYFWEILPWILGHIVIARIVERWFLHIRKHVFATYALLCASFLLGYRTVVFFILHSAICYLSSCLGSFVLVWVTSFLLLLTLNLNLLTPWMKTICGIPNADAKGYYLFIFILALVILRYTSFCLERSKYLKARLAANAAEESEDEEDQFSMLDLLAYVFYLPLFFTGPVITYDEFKYQINSQPASWTKDRIFAALKQFARIFFWAAFLEFSHHFLYYNAMTHSVGTIREMTLWSLVGVGYLNGQYFMVKYVVLYELPAEVARLDDLEPPHGPKCISYIYRYSDMWKYFDRGLYIFLKKYIYIPLGGSQAGLLMRLFGSLACFMYIYEWHGGEYYLLLWTLANYFGCSLELIGSTLERTNAITNIKNQYLSAAMVRRIRCVIVVPLFLLSCFAVFYFFGGVTVGDLFIKRLVTHASWRVLVVFYFLIYANLQNAMEVERWMAVKHRIE